MPQPEKKDDVQVPEKVDAKKDDVKETKVDDAELAKEIKVEEGKTYTAEEAKKIALDSLKKGHVMAKNQYNADITNLKSKVNDLSTEKSDLEKKLADTAKGSEEAVDYKKQIDELTASLNVTTQKLSVMENEGAKAIAEVDVLRQDLSKKELEAHRQKLLADAKGEIIADMVVGNTIEELNNASQKAIEKYKEVTKEVRTKLNLPTEEQQEEEAKPVEIPTLNFAKPDVKDWQKKRDEITKSVYKKYGFPV